MNKAETTNPLREGLPRPKNAAPCAMVIFGATGDLTRRKLVPALYNLAFGNQLPASFAAIGFARRPWTSEEFRAEMRHGIDEFSRRRPVDPKVWDRFGPELEFVAGEFDDPATYERLAARLVALDRERGLQGNRLYYLATLPSDFATILHRLKAAGLLYEPGEGRFS